MPASLQDALVTLLAILYVFAAVVVVLLLFRRHNWQAPEESRWLRNLVKIVVFMLLVSVLGFLLIRHTDFHRGGGDPQGAQGAPSGRNNAGKLPPGATRSAPTFSGRSRSACSGSLFSRASSSSSATADQRMTSPSTSRSGKRSPDRSRRRIDDLRNEPDARRAVIAAYAGMERTLATHGLAAAPSETPFEYLARILRDLDVRRVRSDG